MKKVLCIASFLAMSLSPMVAQNFAIDPAHSSVGFDATHMMISNVKGEFNTFKGMLDIDPKTKKINKLDGEITISSVDTKNQKRDDHLRSSDFFDAQKFPTATFKMTKQDKNKIYGDLTIKGITKPVVWSIDVRGPVENPMTKKQVMALSITGSVSRKDFDVGSSFPTAIVGDEIKVNIQIEAEGQ